MSETLFGPHWVADAGPRPEFDRATLLDPARDPGDPLVDTDGREWKSVIVGDTGVLCAWTEDGMFYLWGPVEELAETTMRLCRGEGP